MESMKFHPSNLGKFGTGLPVDAAGYVVYKARKDFAGLSEDELQMVATCHREKMYRTGAMVELAERKAGEFA